MNIDWDICEVSSFYLRFICVQMYFDKYHFFFVRFLVVCEATSGGECKIKSAWERVGDGSRNKIGRLGCGVKTVLLTPMCFRKSANISFSTTKKSPKKCIFKILFGMLSKVSNIKSIWCILELFSFIFSKYIYIYIYITFFFYLFSFTKMNLMIEEIRFSIFCFN